MEDLTGNPISGYTIIEEIGRGGMAYVYRARQLSLDRECALKILRPELADDRVFVERFLREARAAANLHHPNIVTIYDTGEVNGRYFIAMEYLRGQTLQQIIAAHQLELPEILSCLDQIAAALDYAHNQGIIHRDIKPGNVIADDDGTVTLTDFGIARSLTGTQITITGTLLGTPAYMAPEQIQGLDATTQTDIYQLGIVTYELLAGEPPFARREPHAVMFAHFQEEPEPVHTLVDGLDPQVSAVIDHALKKLPQDRYDNATTFVHELHDAIGVAPAAIRRPLAASDPKATTVRKTPLKDTPPTFQVDRDDIGQPIDSDGQTADSGRLRHPAVWMAAGAVILLLVIAGGAWGFGFFESESSQPDQSDASGIATATLTTVAAAASLTSADDGPTTAIPVRQEIVKSESLEIWPTGEFESGSAYIDDGGYVMSVNREFATLEQQSVGGFFNDGSVTVELGLAPESEGGEEGCLLARVDPFGKWQHFYALCIANDSTTYALYHEQNDAGEVVEEMLMEPSLRPGVNRVEEWNQLEVIAQGHQLWFLANEVLLGTAYHEGPLSGDVGIQVRNLDGAQGAYEFNYLTTFAIKP